MRRDVSATSGCCDCLLLGSTWTSFTSSVGLQLMLHWHTFHLKSKGKNQMTYFGVHLGQLQPIGGQHYYWWPGGDLSARMGKPDVKCTAVQTVQWPSAAQCSTVQSSVPRFSARSLLRMSTGMRLQQPILPLSSAVELSVKHTHALSHVL